MERMDEREEKEEGLGRPIPGLLKRQTGEREGQSSRRWKKGQI